MRASNIGRVVLFVLAAAVTATGCDWRTFDDLAKKTPVLAIGAPAGYPAGDDFGPILLPLAAPTDGSAAGRFIATGVNRTAVGVMYFDAAGGVRGDGVSNDALTTLAQGPASAIAEIPGEDLVLLGAPYGSQGEVLTMSVKPPYTTMMFQNVVEGLFGVGVGAGNIGGGAAAERVIVSASTVHVYTDGVATAEHTYPSLGATDPCPIDFSSTLPTRDQANRAVLIAPFTGTAMQIAVGTPSVSGPGHVAIFDFDASTGAITCAVALTATDAHFGRSMTLVDLEGGDGMKDHLLVGAPPMHAYLYKLPITNGQTPAAMVAADATGGGQFGFSVAAFDLDGKAGDEMFVGDPDASVNGTATAGQVTIYTGLTMTKLTATATVPNPLAMHEPKAGNGYGSGIAGMPFCPGIGADGGVAACTVLPLVGSTSKAYAYFTLKKPDPRVK